MDIFKIRQLSKQTSPYFFTEKTLDFFGQTMRSFKVEKVGERYKISAPMIDQLDHVMGETVRYFNPINNELERK